MDTIKSDNITPKLVYINQMQEMWHFLEKHSSLDQSDLAKKFIAEIIEPQREKYMIFYDYLTPEVVGVYLSHLLMHPEALKSLCLTPDTAIIDGIANAVFQRIPDFPQATKVYLMPAFGDIFKGMAFPLGEENVIRLGLDELSNQSESIFRTAIQHELMHIYHYHKNPDYRQKATDFLFKNQLPKLYQIIWAECLPTLAVRNFNPMYGYEDLFDWQALIDAVEKVKPDIAKLMEYNLDTTSISGFFYFASDNYPNLPVGCGYYLGLQILEDISTRYPLQEMFTLTDEIILREVRISLGKVSGKTEYRM